MKLLVTGGAGFIGGAIVNAALGRGYTVRVLDSLRADVHGGVPPQDPRVEFVHGDVRDHEVATNALEGMDAVCHQAAKVGLGVDFSDAPDYVSSNDHGTAVLLAAMAAQGTKRLVIASSMVVYGEGSYLGPNGLTRPAPARGKTSRLGTSTPATSTAPPLSRPSSTRMHRSTPATSTPPPNWPRRTSRARGRAARAARPQR